MASFACDICFNDYDFNNFRPVVGSCGHSICLNCSRRILGICPKCRERSFNNPRTNFGMLELLENVRIERENAENLLRAVQETFDEVDQEKMLQKLSLDQKSDGQEHSRETISSEMSNMPRNVVLKAAFAGIRICGPRDSGRANGKIFVTRVDEGGVADGLVHVGDHILSLNGESFDGKTLDEAEKMFRNAGNPLKLRLQYKPQEFQRERDAQDEFLRTSVDFGKNPVQGELFVRALHLRNVPGKNSLDFKFGEILQITHKPQKEFWMARKVFDNGSKGEMGIIMSNDYEESERWGNVDKNQEPLSKYVVVKRHFDSSIRPIVVLGALGEMFRKVLKERRSDLVGRIIYLSPAAIRRLHQKNVYPIVIFIGPLSLRSICDLSNNAISEGKAERKMEEIKKLERERSLFTMRFYGFQSFDKTVSLALEHIDKESRPSYWIPSEDQSGLLCE